MRREEERGEREERRRRRRGERECFSLEVVELEQLLTSLTLTLTLSMETGGDKVMGFPLLSSADTHTH